MSIRPFSVLIMLVMLVMRVMLIVVLIAATNTSAFALERSITNDGAVVTPESWSESWTRGPARATAMLDTTTARTGGTITLTLMVDVPNGIAITMPELPAVAAPLSARGVSHRPDVPTDTGRQWMSQYRFHSFVAVELTIPELTIGIRDERNVGNVIETELTTDAIRVTFIGVADRAAQKSTLEAELDAPLALVDDSDDLAGAGGGSWLTLGNALWLTGFIALIAAIFWLVARHRQAVAAPEPEIPADVQARTALSALAESSFVRDEDWDSFYTRLSWIVRTYIERRWDIAAPDQTTDEFLRRVPQHRAFPTHFVESLASMLRRADMVKFARQASAAGECHAAIDHAIDFVNATAPPDDAVTRTTEVAA
jgi:hypothetical protein